MGMISNFSIQKSNEKFKKNEEALAKLKHYTGQHNPLVYQTNSQYLKKEDQSLTNSPEHNFISHSLKKSEETNPIYPTNNRSSPKSKRPSIFSLKNSEEALNKGKFQVNDAEKPLKQENNTVESSKINIKSISLEQDIDYLVKNPKNSLIN